MGTPMSAAIPFPPPPDTARASANCAPPAKPAPVPATPPPPPSFAIAVLAALAAGKLSQRTAAPSDTPPVKGAAAAGKRPRDAGRKPAASTATPVQPTVLALAGTPAVVGPPAPLQPALPRATAAKPDIPPTKDAPSVGHAPAQDGKRGFPATRQVATAALALDAPTPPTRAIPPAKAGRPATPATLAAQAATGPAVLSPTLRAAPDAGARAAPGSSHPTTPPVATTPHAAAPEPRAPLPATQAAISNLALLTVGSAASATSAPTAASTARATVAQVSATLAQLPRPPTANATTITLHLAPPALGDVAIRISAPHGAPPVVTISTSHQASAEALATARPNLEASLLRAGLPAETRVILHPPGTPPSGGETPDRGFRQPGGQPRRHPPPARSVSETDFAAALDISA